MTSLKVSEVFLSLQGETSRIGLPTVFVRLTGCPLRCGYCDTAYAFAGGIERSIPSLLDEVAAFGVRYVTVTGGEPLVQRGSLELMAELCGRGHEVSLETGGALDISAVDARVARIVDLKAPGSGEASRNLWSNLAHLRPSDEIKIVLTDEKDYLWARDVLLRHGLDERCPVLFSPAAGLLEPSSLAEWILRDRLPVRFQLQLHKILWGDARGR